MFGFHVTFAADSANYQTRQGDDAGATEFSGTSVNYDFRALVGQPGVGDSVSTNYIFTHGVMWDEASSTPPPTPVSGGPSQSSATIGSLFCGEGTRWAFPPGKCVAETAASVPSPQVICAPRETDEPVAFLPPPAESNSNGIVLVNDQLVNFGEMSVVEIAGDRVVFSGQLEPHLEVTILIHP